MPSSRIGAITPAAVIIATVADPWAMRITAVSSQASGMSPSPAAAASPVETWPSPASRSVTPRAPPAAITRMMLPASVTASAIEPRTAGMPAPQAASSTMETSAASDSATFLSPRIRTAARTPAGMASVADRDNDSRLMSTKGSRIGSSAAQSGGPLPAAVAEARVAAADRAGSSGHRPSAHRAYA